MKRILLVILIALAAAGIFVSSHFDPLGSYVYADPCCRDPPPP